MPHPSPSLHAVILAGGGGVRFWPMGRKARPKQFLPLVSERTLLQDTAVRCRPLIGAVKTWVVTGSRYAEETQQQLGDIPSAHLVQEPCGRNTAPAIGLGVIHVLSEDPDAIVAVFPADHAIQPAEAFQDCLAEACRVIGAHPDGVVLLGAKPTAPVTGFGYIEQGDPVPQRRAYRVRTFHEKPNLETAQQFVASGRHLWNCGIFVFRAQRMLELLDQFQPETARQLRLIAVSLGTPDEDATLASVFPQMPSVSIDKGVIEKAREVFVIPATFQWADVGTWQTLAAFLGPDEDGNTIVGLHAGVDTQGCLIHSQHGHLVATIGLRDCVIVHTPDATLIARKDDEEGLRKLVALLEERGHGRFA